MILLNYKSGVPIWEQIRDGFKRQILADVLTAGDKLPSVRALASELGINPNTIQRAYTELETTGFVYTVAGRGCFVAEKSEGSLIAEQSARLEDFKKAVKEALESGIDKKRLLEILEKETEE